MLGCNVKVTKMFWDLTHHVLRVAFAFILFSFLFVCFKFVFGQGFLKSQKFQCHMVAS